MTDMSLILMLAWRRWAWVLSDKLKQVHDPWCKKDRGTTAVKFSSNTLNRTASVSTDGSINVCDLLGSCKGFNRQSFKDKGSVTYYRTPYT